MSHPNKKHGWSRTAEYNIWGHMIQRCTNPKNKDYQNYGGRGIKVCDRWRDFQLFIADMGPRPSSDLSIDREDVNGDYCPKNCRWATPTQQARNTRRTLRLESGEAVSYLLDKLDMPRETLKSRLDRGMSLEAALVKPVSPRSQKRGDLFLFMGRELTATEISQITGVNLNTFKYRLRAGWSVDEAATLPLKGRAPKGVTKLRIHRKAES